MLGLQEVVVKEFVFHFPPKASYKGQWVSNPSSLLKLLSGRDLCTPHIHPPGGWRGLHPRGSPDPLQDVL